MSCKQKLQYLSVSNTGTELTKTWSAIETDHYGKKGVYESYYTDKKNLGYGRRTQLVDDIKNYLCIIRDRRKFI